MYRLIIHIQEADTLAVEQKVSSTRESSVRETLTIDDTNKCCEIIGIGLISSIIDR